MFNFFKDKFNAAKADPKCWKFVIWAIVGLVAALLVFRAGTMVGFRKAQFSYGWSEGYRRNFGGPPQGGMGSEFMADRFVGGHGVTGSVISIAGEAFLVQDRDGTEKTVVIGQDTEIRRLRSTVAPSELKIDDFVVVIGDPDGNGQVHAKLIRILPEPPFDGRGRR